MELNLNTNFSKPLIYCLLIKYLIGKPLPVNCVKVSALNLYCGIVSSNKLINSTSGRFSLLHISKKKAI